MIDKYEKIELGVKSEFDSEIRVFVYGTLMKGNSDYEQSYLGPNLQGIL